MKTWNLGNTTVRNPERIKDALVVLEQFEGQRFTIEVQEKFFNELLRANVVEGNPEREGGKAFNGRKWGTVFNQLGLARCWTSKPPIEITAVGKALLRADTLDADIYLRQILKIQLPSLTESNLENASIHPFFLVLKLSLRLYQQDLTGLTKEELALFVQFAYRDDQVEELLNQILNYRKERQKHTGRVPKSRYFLAQLASRIDAVGAKIKPGTLLDYADTTIRYSVITGLFSVGRQSLVLKEDQTALAKALVDQGDPAIIPNDQFLEYFYNPDVPSLPTDDASFLRRDLEDLSRNLVKLSSETGDSVKLPILDKSEMNVLKLRKQRADIEEELILQKEIQFYHKQHEAEQVEDILGVFESIKNREIIGGSDYYPAWAEWGVWRVFLAINSIANPISETRGFRIDSELYPIHHAKGGAVDLRFEYEKNEIIPAEVTLNTGESQYAAEKEPVERHVLRVMEKNPEATVVSVFVAPNIQVGTAHAFMGTQYSEKFEKAVSLNIVPLTIEQLCQFLPGQKLGCRNYTELKGRLDDILNLKKESEDGRQWLYKIAGYFDSVVAATLVV